MEKPTKSAQCFTLIQYYPDLEVVTLAEGLAYHRKKAEVKTGCGSPVNFWLLGSESIRPTFFVVVVTVIFPLAAFLSPILYKVSKPFNSWLKWENYAAPQVLNQLMYTHLA